MAEALGGISQQSCNRSCPGSDGCRHREKNEAVDHFSVGYQYAKNNNLPIELAWSCCDWADCLIRQGAAENRLKAKILLEEGLAIAEKLSMKSLKERISERLEKLEVKKVYPDGLTSA